MPSLSDTLLAAGCVRQIGAIHGETIQVLQGPDAGRSFQANIIESEADLILATDLGNDPRAKRMLRFADGDPLPRITSQAQIKTSDGKKWNAVRQDFASYLTTDFELKEIVPGKDT